MSKLSRALKEQEIDRVDVAPGVTLVSSARDVEFLDATRYEVGLQLKAEVVVTDKSRERFVAGDALTGAVNAAKRQLVEEVFGEFRVPLLRARGALFIRDLDVARKALDEIYYRMFDDL